MTNFEIDSYSENWKKAGTTEKVFYARNKILLKGVILFASFIGFTIIALIKGIPIPYGMPILACAVYLLLQWNTKFIIIGETFVTFCKPKIQKNKCLLFKNILNIENDKLALIITLKSQDNKTTPCDKIVIKTNKMSPKDRVKLIKCLKLH